MPFTDPEKRELKAADESWKSLWSSGTGPDDELQDGTNLPAGTNYIWQQRKSERWFEPAAVVENPNWRRTLERLSERMKAFQLQGKRFPVYLKQSQIPPLGGDTKAPVSVRDCSCGTGLDLEPVHLRPQVVVVPSFSFPDATGKPIATSTGEPSPFRLGFSRTHYVKRASAEDLQLFSDAAKVLSVLPVFVNEVLWKRWRQGFPLPEDGFDEGVWIDAVFETSWQQLPFSSLRASRAALSSDGKTSAVLKGEGLFPRIPPAFRSMVPHVHGYPQRIRSELPDLLECSIQLIETIRAIPEPGHEEVETDKGLKKVPKPTAAKTGRPVKKKLTKQQLQAIHRRVEKKETLTNILTSYPDFKDKYATFRRLYRSRSSPTGGV